jgi:hypothetical protein
MKQSHSLESKASDPNSNRHWKKKSMIPGSPNSRISLLKTTDICSLVAAHLSLSLALSLSCAAEIVLYYCNKAAENPTVLRACFKGNIFIQKSKERKTRLGCMNCAVQALI